MKKWSTRDCYIEWNTIMNEKLGLLHFSRESQPKPLFAAIIAWGVDPRYTIDLYFPILIASIMASQPTTPKVPPLEMKPYEGLINHWFPLIRPYQTLISWGGYGRGGICCASPPKVEKPNKSSDPGCRATLTWCPCSTPRRAEISWWRTWGLP